MISDRERRDLIERRDLEYAEQRRKLGEYRRQSPPRAGRCDSDFQAALQAAYDEGRVLHLNADVALDATVAIRMDRSHTGWHGLDGHGYRITSHVKGAPVLRFYMDDQTPVSTCSRSMVLANFSMLGNGDEEGGVIVEVPFNDRWLVNPLWRDLWFEYIGGEAGMQTVGSIFEGNLYSVGTMDCKGAGLIFRNAGPSGNQGMVSALRLFGGTHRQNGGPGIMMDQYDGPPDVRLSGLYFCSNKDVGLLTRCGCETVSDCGFENNAGDGIYFENRIYLRNCSGSTFGPQKNLLRGYVCNPATIRSCRVQGYGGAGNDENWPKLASLIGSGVVTVSDCDEGGEIEHGEGVILSIMQTAETGTVRRPPGRRL
jgi:hypothetical protein